MQDIAPVVNTLPEVKELVNNLLILLSPKEKHIIENRYSLNDKPHATLEKIGQEFGVTRERIRQIEKNALRKLSRNVVNTKLNLCNQFANTLLQKYAGVSREDKLVSEMLALANDVKGIDISSIKLSIELDANIEKIPNTINCVPYFKFKTIERNEIHSICERAIKFLSDKKDVTPLDDLIHEIEKDENKKHDRQFVASCLEVDRRLKVVKKGIGLAQWRHINPRTLRDKIHFILHEAGKPLHYVEISNRIAEARFDNKVINVQAVHNELIRDPDFVLIGRGIYALRTWGYEDGTVAEVIANILREKGPLERDQIINEVLKKRHVKRITILLNLKNKPIFERVGRNAYAMKS